MCLTDVQMQLLWSNALLLRQNGLRHKKNPTSRETSGAKIANTHKYSKYYKTTTRTTSTAF